jgi:type IV secretion system protein VirB8
MMHPLSPAARQQYFAETSAYTAELRRVARDRWRASCFIAGAGVGVGLLGIIAAASVFPLKQPPTAVYVLVNKETGEISEAAGVKDAPKLFSDAVDRRAVREYVEDRESYDASLDAQNFHRVAIMSSPDEQKLYAAAHKETQAHYGKTGKARLSNWRLVLRGKTKNGTIAYDAHFYKTEVISDQVQPAKPWTAFVAFQWRPGLPMAAQDRLVNAGGMQVISYSAKQDPGS